MNTGMDPYYVYGHDDDNNEGDEKKRMIITFSMSKMH